MSRITNEIIFKEIKDKGVIILNRPKMLNTLNVNMVQQLLFKLKQWTVTKKLVLLKAVGSKAFSAGGDMKEAIESYRSANYQHGFNIFRIGYTCCYAVSKSNIPFVALIDGIVMGGGAGLAAPCRYRVVTKNAVFAMPENKIGLIPDVGATYYFSRMPRNLGVFLALTGSRLKGWDVVNSGFATHFCKSSNLEMLEEEILQTKSEIEIQNVLEKFQNIETNPGFTLNTVSDKIEEYFSGNSVEDIMKKLENDNSEWAKSTAGILKKMSPTSLKLTLKAVRLGGNLNLKECYKMEFNVNSNCMKSKNFHEGVRAMLIDKDEKPKWDPPTLEEVTDETIDRFFRQTEPFDMDQL